MAISITNFQPTGTLPLWAILRLPSLHSCQEGEPTTLDAKGSVSECLPRVRRSLLFTMTDGIKVDPIHINFGREMVKIYNGVKIPEVLLDKLIVGNGHHRIACAKHMNLDTLDYTNCVFDSGADWRYYFPDRKLGKLA